MRTCSRVPVIALRTFCVFTVSKTLQRSREKKSGTKPHIECSTANVMIVKNVYSHEQRVISYLQSHCVSCGKTFDINFQCVICAPEKSTHTCTHTHSICFITANVPTKIANIVTFNVYITRTRIVLCVFYTQAQLCEC